MYKKFALIYDQVMRNVDYPKWAEYIMDLAIKYDFDTTRICDLACGTGVLALFLAEKGCEVVGVDGSSAMIDRAEQKTKQANGSGLIWKQADLTKFKLGERFSLITCLYDSVNYLLEEKEVLKCLKCTFDHLKPGGGFIFDITTEYNILENFADYTFAENFDDYSYIWENTYNVKSKVIISEVTIFQKDGDRFYKNFETHHQKIYSVAKIDLLARRAGYNVLGIFAGFTLNAPGPRIERVHFVCKRP